MEGSPRYGPLLVAKQLVFQMKDGGVRRMQKAAPPHLQMAPVSRTVFGSGRVMQLSSAPWFPSAKTYPILWERLDNLFSPSRFLGV